MMPTARLVRDGKVEGRSHVKSDSPCQSQEGSPGQVHDQEGMQASSHRTLCEFDQKNVPFLCRLRMNCMNQDQDNIFLQEYRRVVTVIRQEDIGADVHDKAFPDAIYVRLKPHA